jgi:hypothetical protein
MPSLDRRPGRQQSSEVGRDELSVPALGSPATTRKGKVDLIIGAATALRGPMGRHSRATTSTSTAQVLRRVKRLIWFALVACVALIGTLESRQELPQQLSIRLALAVILVASWAIVLHVTSYLRAEDARRAAESEAARLEGARLTASAMQDRIANKLSLTVGYAEFLLTDPRLPEDLREHAQKAMDGARAAAEQMSELKRLTRREYEDRVKENGAASTTPGSYDSDRLREMIAPVHGDSVPQVESDDPSPPKRPRGTSRR